VVKIGILLSIHHINNIESSFAILFTGKLIISLSDKVGYFNFLLKKPSFFSLKYFVFQGGSAYIILYFLFGKGIIPRS